MIDIPTLKAELRAEGTKATLTDLLALAPKNDPFGVFTEARVRRMHYWLVSSNVQKPDGTLSEIEIDSDVNTEPPRSDLTVDTDDWLFDSGREYVDQLRWYKHARDETVGR